MMKKRLLCSELKESSGFQILPASEAHHALRVLRLKQGDLVEILDGQGHRALGRLIVENQEVQVRYQKVSPQPCLPPIVLEIAILKAQAMSWVLQKAVELGITQLIPLITARTIVRPNNPEAFQKRLQKRADQALKQCGRSSKMHVTPVCSLKKCTPTLRFWCDENAYPKQPSLLEVLFKQPKTENAIHILVGPEGGWDPQEYDFLKELGTPVHLGASTLRAETAALKATSLIGSWLELKEKLPE